MVARTIITDTTFSDLIELRSADMPHESHARKGDDHVFGIAFDHPIVGEMGSDNLVAGDRNHLFKVLGSPRWDYLAAAGYDAMRGDNGDTTIPPRNFAISQSAEVIDGHTVVGTAGDNELNLSEAAPATPEDTAIGAASPDWNVGSRGDDVLGGGGSPDAAFGSIRRDLPVVINVLGNDEEADRDDLTIASLTQAAHGLTHSAFSGFTGAGAFTYTAIDQAFTGSAGVSPQVLSSTLSLSGPTFRQILTTASENEWVRVNVNRFQEVWTPFLHRADGGNRMPDTVIGAWSSMAWDSQRGDLIFWGGGHANYPGNEVYRWRSSTLQWERASLPSEIVEVAANRSEAIDGYLNAPISSHTYDNSEYLPIIDRFVTFGGAAWGDGGSFKRTDGLSKTGPYFWDPAKGDGDKVGGTTGSHANPERFPDVVGGEMWENRDNLSRSGLKKNLVNGATAYREEDGKDVLYFGRTSLFKYTVHDQDDPTRDTYEKVGSYFNAFTGDGAGAISNDLNVYLRTSKYKFVMWDLNHASTGNKNFLFLPTDPSGTFDFARLRDYGMDYDPVRGNFILWKGDAEVWALTPPAHVSVKGWTLTPLSPEAANQAPDVDGSTSGVLGKWKYLQDLDIFIGVNDGRNGDVWVYKPNDWQPSNALPELTASTTVELEPGQAVRLSDLIDWSDPDGDALSFRLTDLSSNPTTGHFILNGETQRAGQEITVTADQLVLGDLLWVVGENDQPDDIAIKVSDPFDSAPTYTASLLPDRSGTTLSVVLLDSDGGSSEDLASLTTA